MHRRVSIIVLLLNIIFFAGGCALVQKEMEKMSEPEPLKIAVPDRQILSRKDLPPDVKVVMAALVNRMRGERDRVSVVRFDPEGTHNVEERGFHYEGFDLKMAEISGFQAKRIKKNQTRALIEGFFHFEDIIGRRTSVYYTADYTKSGEGIKIHDSAVVLIPPAFPRVRAYFVPQKTVEAVPKNTLTSIADLYLFAVNSAVSMTANEDERKAREAKKKMSIWDVAKWKDMVANTGEDDLLLMVFCMDRIPDDSLLEMKVTSAPYMGGTEVAETIYRYEKGWRMMVAGGRFDPDGDGSNIYASVKFMADRGNEGESPVFIACFKNEKDYSPVKTAESGTFIESGRKFLDPDNRSDARIIQSRLKELGFYTSKVDGLFGRGSKTALGKFIVSAGLGGRTRWTIEVQKVLFEGTGM